MKLVAPTAVNQQIHNSIYTRQLTCRVFLIPVKQGKSKMKQPENTIAVKVAEYRLYITRLRVCRDSLAGCCSDAERGGWRLRALEQLSKASSFNCQRANSADTSKFQQAREGLQQHINKVLPEGQWCSDLAALPATQE
ncbi:TPA: hypothetical protein SMJ97_005341 [Klebsiella oxytoca]|nr:hypothetical protein [Klebsiella oxytoca]HEJ8589287.1 hypothetical protein [Klebsiella oxytoca]